jgi:hypothetical protein
MTDEAELIDCNGSSGGWRSVRGIVQTMTRG